VTDVLSRKLQDVNIPILIIHGTGDTVTDPAVSQELYDKAKSQDKTLKMYDGMSHVLFQAEPDDNVAIIVKDTTLWLRERVEKWHSVHPSS
jgi:alpha-beta hydrolase superfamily lysophospholipase